MARLYFTQQLARFTALPQLRSSSAAPSWFTRQIEKAAPFGAAAASPA